MEKKREKKMKREEKGEWVRKRETESDRFAEAGTVASTACRMELVWSGLVAFFPVMLPAPISNPAPMLKYESTNEGDAALDPPGWEGARVQNCRRSRLALS